MNSVRSCKKWLRLVLSFSLVLMLSGCWSSNEIEDLSIFVGMALDKASNDKEEPRVNKEPGSLYEKKNRIISTIQIVAPPTAKSEGKSGGPPLPGYVNYTEVGDSVFEMVRESALKTDRPVIGHHLKVIVVGEELARSYRIDKLMDFFNRDNDIRQSSLVFISRGRASEALESKQPGIIPSFRLFGMVDNRYRNSKILPPVRLGELIGKMQSGTSFLLQNVNAAEGEIKFAGAAVIEGKTKKLRGFLTEDELDSVIWISGEGKGGLVKTFDPPSGQLITYEVKSMKSRVTSEVSGDSVSFGVHITTEGRIIEDWVKGGNPFDNSFIRSAQRTVEDVIKTKVTRTLSKMQKEFKVDVAGFDTQMKIEHPKIWEKLKHNWDVEFSQASVQFDIKVLINEYGASGGGIK